MGFLTKKSYASSGNRTRAARVAGEHSTTEPTMLCCDSRDYLKILSTCQEQHSSRTSRDLL